MYNTILNLLVTALGAVVDTVPYVTCEVMATIACVFLVSLPFIIVWRIIRMMIG